MTDAAITTDTRKPKRPNPIAVAEATGVGQKLAAIRAQRPGWGPSRKDLAKLSRSGDGVSMMNQAPHISSDTVAGLEHMIRMVPTTRRHRPFRLNVGDPAAAFSIQGSDGKTVSLSSLVGRKPFALRLTRAQGSGIICPACVPGLDELTRTYEDFEVMGVELMVVFPVSHELTKDVVDNLDLPYPIYSDEDWTLFKAYDTGFSAGPPLPAWVIGDIDGIIRFLWRAADGGLFDHYPESSEILAELKVIADR
jgi:peroxiredoxin